MCWLKPRPSSTLGECISLRMQVSPVLTQESFSESTNDEEEVSSPWVKGVTSRQRESLTLIYWTWPIVSDSVKIWLSSPSVESMSDCRRTGSALHICGDNGPLKKKSRTQNILHSSNM